MKDKKNICSKVAWVVVSSALTVAGFIFIPPFIQKYGSKAYKKSLKNDEIDLDEMGPKIVPFNEETKEEE